VVLFPPLVAAVLITPKAAESPGSGRIGVIGALTFFPTCVFRFWQVVAAGPARESEI